MGVLEEARQDLLDFVRGHREAPGKDNRSIVVPCPELIEVHHRHPSIGLEVELVVSREDMSSLRPVVEDLEIIEDWVSSWIFQEPRDVNPLHSVLKALSIPGPWNDEEREVLTDNGSPFLKPRLFLCGER